jgi:ribosome maturation factor RimP
MSTGIDNSQPKTDSPDTASRNVKAEDRLLARLNEILAPLGYELVHLEVQTHRQKILRLFIDKLDRSHDEHRGGIGIEDCAVVSKTLDEPLEAIPEVAEIFGPAPYELEVSSPGVDRPLRREEDYLRFAGRRIRLNTFRPLAAEEMENAPYATQNPRQKNFLGELLGFESGKVRLKSSIGGAEVRIPLPLVAKANLDPDFDFEPGKEKK